MSDLLGDVAQLENTSTVFNAVHVARGQSGVGHFTLHKSDGFRQLVDGFASVEITSDKLSVQVHAPAKPEIGVRAAIALVPSGLDSYPTAQSQIVAVGGSTTVKDSIYNSSETPVVGFPPSTSKRVLPAPYIGAPPEVVFWFEAPGADSSTELLIIVSGTLRATGIGFRQTW